ncbi:MAG: PAS domain-containing protein, partial [Candidatus Thorarchaeota archaeon]
MIKIGKNQLDNTENLFKAIYNDSPIGIELYDFRGKLIDLNKSCMELFGVSNKSDVKGFDLLNDPNIPREHLTKLKQRETVRYESEFDFDLVKKNKLYKTTKSGKIYLDVLITPLFLRENKSISNYLVHIQDISDSELIERKLKDLNAELEKKVQDKVSRLKKSERNYELITENVNDIITVVNVKGQVEYINEDVHKKIMGYSFKDMGYKNVFDLVHPEDREKAVREFNNVIKSGEGFIEVRMYNKGGYYIWTETNGKVFLDDDGKMKILTISRDITERKRAEMELKESEERFRHLVSSNPAIIYTTKSSGDFGTTFISQNIKNLTGFEPEDYINNVNFWFDHIHPDDIDQVSNRITKLYDKGYHTHEYRFQFKNGEYHWIRDEQKLLYDENGNPSEIIGFWIDISNQKVAEYKLKESESKLQGILSSMTDQITILDNQFNIVYANDNVKKIYGSSVEGTKCYELYHNRKEVCEECQVAKTFVDMAVHHKECERIKKNGDKYICWCTSSVAAISESGKPTLIIEVSRDITEQKKIEEELRKSEAKYRVFLENFQGIAFQGHLDFTPIFFQGNVKKITGYTEKDFLSGNPRWDQIILNEDIEKIYNSIKKIHDIPNAVINREYRIFTKDGKVNWVHEIIQNISDENGKPYMVQGIIHEISDRKKAEEKIQYQAKLVDDVSDAIISIDLKFNIKSWNKAAKSIYGWESEEVVGKNIRDIIPTEYPNDKVKEVLKQFFENGFWKGEVIQYNKEGLPINILSSVSMIHDIAGNPNGAVAINRDISERIKAENELRKKEISYKKLAENLP